MSSIKPVKLSFNEYEPSSGLDENLAPIIYLHGLTVSKEYWEDIPQTVADATKRKAYAIDSRNHGETEWNDCWNLDINVDDLIHFMDSHDIRKAILVGHSMGGVTSIKAALKKPDMVEKVIIEEMIVRVMPEEQQKTASMYITLLQKSLELAPTELDDDDIKEYSMKYVLENLPPEMTMVKESIKEKDYKHVLRLRRLSSGRYAHEANLKVIGKALENPSTLNKEAEGVYNGPALFIYGKLSPLSVGSDQDHIKQFFPNAVFKEIEDATHNVHIDQPQAFTDAVLEFVS